MTKREPHTITPTRGNTIPRSVIFFDTETRVAYSTALGDVHKMKLAVAKHYVKRGKKAWQLKAQIICYRPHQLVAFIHQCTIKQQRTYLISHGLIFDMLVSNAINLLSSAHWDLCSFYFKGMTAILDWRQGKARLTCLNLGNFYHAKLEDIGSLIDLPKLKVDFTADDMPNLLEYCIRDVDIVAKAFFHWLDFLAENDFGSFKNTLSSTAWNIWRRKYLKGKVYVHNEETTLKLEQESYRGGRILCANRGYYNTQRYYKLDVNSMYGFVMAEHSYPVSLYNHKQGCSLDKLKRLLEVYCVIARVNLNSHDQAYAVHHLGKTLYPQGRFEATLTTPELHYALFHNHIEHIHEVAWYQKAPIFRDFAFDLYDKRLMYRRDRNDIYAKIIKLLIPSLYGKFGQRGINLKFIGKPRIWMDFVEEVYSYGKPEVARHITLAGKTYLETHEGWSYHAFPAIASHVTAYGRMYLWLLREIAEPENVYYGDTDSLVVNALGLEHLYRELDEYRLGALRIEEVTDFINILAPKHYETQHSVRHKGIRADAIEFDENRFAQSEFAGIMTMMRVGELSGVLVRDVEKTLKFDLLSHFLDEQTGEVVPQMLHSQVPPPPPPPRLAVLYPAEREQQRLM